MPPSIHLIPCRFADGVDLQCAMNARGLGEFDVEIIHCTERGETKRVVRVEDGFVCHDGNGTALADSLQTFDVPVGKRLFADFDFVFCQCGEDVDGSDFVPGLICVEPHGNAAANRFTDGANAGDVFRFVPCRL
jgi:hypothetical protein